MKTLYLRNVPDEVVARLDRLARREGVSVSAVAIRELADVTRRADNEALLAGLPDTDVEPTEMLAALDDGRRRRG
jgi:predicted transcriptional regulator